MKPDSEMRSSNGRLALPMSPHLERMFRVQGLPSD
jgi:hypothetical protein